MIRNAFHLTLLATLLSIPAFAKAFYISPLPESPYADTEVTTNIAFNTNRGDVKFWGPLFGASSWWGAEVGSGWDWFLRLVYRK